MMEVPRHALLERLSRQADLSSAPREVRLRHLPFRLVLRRLRVSRRHIRQAPLGRSLRLRQPDLHAEPHRRIERSLQVTFAHVTTLLGGGRRALPANNEDVGARTFAGVCGTPTGRSLVCGFVLVAPDYLRSAMTRDGFELSDSALKVVHASSAS
jgi:hypothetical protein